MDVYLLAIFWISAIARQVFPIAGIAFSRLLTRHLRNTPVATHGQKGGLKPSITYGPCQTPALGFCVARQDTGPTGWGRWGRNTEVFSSQNAPGLPQKIMSLSLDVP